MSTRPIPNPPDPGQFSLEPLPKLAPTQAEVRALELEKQEAARRKPTRDASDADSTSAAAPSAPQRTGGAGHSS